MPFRSPKSRKDRSRTLHEPLLGDKTAFLRTLLENPRLTGAVAPSGPHLARAMARAAATAREGLIVELGPGTGPVTKALIEQGFARDRLVLVEYDAAFCRLLAQRFAPARVIQGDAYDLPTTLADLAGRRIAAIVSSLPLLNQPEPSRAKLIADAFELMGPMGVFVQFTYGLKSPIPRKACVNKYSAHCSAPIWRNLPPARVWSYRADPNGRVSEPMLGKIRDGADRLGRSWDAKKGEARQMLRIQRVRMRAMLDREVKAMFAAGRARRGSGRRQDPPSETPL
jgi:phosphatidylethanolamine/phosphatidyl-N-methylethanolamine N-methyltransferase